MVLDIALTLENDQFRKFFFPPRYRGWIPHLLVKYSFFKISCSLIWCPLGRLSSSSSVPTIHPSGPPINVGTPPNKFFSVFKMK